MKKIVTLALCLLLALGIAVTASAAASASMSGLPASIDKDGEATVIISLSGTPEITSALVQIELGEGLSLVSGKWLVDSDNVQIANFKAAQKQGALALDPGATIDGEAVRIKIKGVKPAANQTVKVSFTFKNGADEVGTASVTKSVDVACPGHQYGAVTKIDDNQHGKTCSICGDVQKANHGWDKGTVTKPATCKEEGEKTFACADCGAKKTEALPKVDHKFGNLTPVDGTSHKDTCSTCNETVTEPHKFGEGTVTKEANCKEEGEMTYTCSGCGYKKVEPIEKTDDHKFGNLTAVDGTNHKDTCSVCNKEITEAHKFDGGKVTKKATCKEEGEMTYTCTGCGYKKVESIAKTEDHVFGNLVSVDDKNHKDVCKVCQKEVTEPHTWNSGKVTKKPTCKEEGVKTYTCTGCSATYTEAISKTEDHKYGSWQKVDDENHKRTCSVCAKEETAAHGYKTSWSKDKSGHWHECSGCKDKKDFAKHTPGAAATEKKAQTCTVCNYVIKAALGHTHKWDKTLTSDATGHWYECSGCEEKKDVAAHDFENGCDPDCATCGFTREVAHDISEAWASDGTNHWHECTICGMKEGESAHEPGAEATEFTAQTCSICDKELVAALGHSFSEQWNSDEENHWRDCACGEKGELAKHTYEDGACSVCGAEEPKSFPIWIIIAVAAVAVVAVVVVIVVKKKKN